MLAFMPACGLLIISFRRNNTVDINFNSLEADEMYFEKWCAGVLTVARANQLMRTYHISYSISLIIW